MPDITDNHVHQSNLIEGFDDPTMDACGIAAWEMTFSLGIETVEDVWRVHRVVTAAQPDPDWVQWDDVADWRGRWRTVDLTVGGRDCPPWAAVPDLMTGWMERWNNAVDEDPRELHVAFEKIHPFSDGNGRIGRMLMWHHEAVLLGREPTLITYDNRLAYYRWFSLAS